MCRVILYLGKYSVQVNCRLQRVEEYCCVMHSFLCTVLECTHGVFESVCVSPHCNFVEKGVTLLELGLSH
jgi:hypothetical protein